MTFLSNVFYILTQLSANQAETIPLLDLSRCVKVENIGTVCQNVAGRAVSNLTINYTGQLVGSNKLNVYVRLNGRDGVFPTTKYVSNSTRDFFVSLTDGKFNCRFQNPDDETTVCETPTSEMISLFRAAYDRSRTPAWKIELAFVDENGNWDSAYGQNYKVEFAPQYN